MKPTGGGIILRALFGSTVPSKDQWNKENRRLPRHTPDNPCPQETATQVAEPMAIKHNTITDPLIQIAGRINDVPVLSDGVYHIDSFILGVPKTAIIVGLQDDFKRKYRRASNVNIDYETENDDEIMTAISNNTSSPYSEQGSEEQICYAINAESDEFVIVPQRSLPSRCKWHSNLLATADIQDDLSGSSTSYTSNSSQSPQTANTVSSTAGDMKYLTANTAGDKLQYQCFCDNQQKHNDSVLCV
uniref:Uncharacterized protein n=1 Tax=Glossina austeni TaxID=7395 RepID=A0A1A9USY4_GLOAU